MPFGKANSSRVFCVWTSAWCRSFKYHFQNHHTFPIALAVYMDDFFGGPIRTGSLSKDFESAQKLFKDLIVIGAITNTFMNLKKCEEPARSKDILGMNFNSKEKACFLAKTKVTKYKSRLANLRRSKEASSKELQKIVGSLVYAAWVMPFGRPFISHIAHFINVKDVHKKVQLDLAALVACDIWLFLLEKNRGLRYDFILGKLPPQKDEWFVDASFHGYGGVCGSSYFIISQDTFLKKLHPKTRNFFNKMPIAYRELLAVLLAFQVFADIAPNFFIRINSDNTNVVTWLNKGRCSKKLGFLILSAIEAFKFKYGLRVRAYHIKSRNNTSADNLSRGRTPEWLASGGWEKELDVQRIISLIENPLPFLEILIKKTKLLSKAFTKRSQDLADKKAWKPSPQ